MDSLWPPIISARNGAYSATVLRNRIFSSQAADYHHRFFVAQWFYEVSIWYLKWNISIIRGNGMMEMNDTIRKIAFWLTVIMIVSFLLGFVTDKTPISIRG